MILLKILFACFPMEDMIKIYIIYIHSVVEQSAVVWHISLTGGEQLDLERVQKVALCIILKDDYTGYSDALELTGLENLEGRNYAITLLKNVRKMSWPKTCSHWMKLK